jgi:hypothetical protein
METVLDIFRADQFHVASMDYLAATATYIPQGLEQLNLFRNIPVSTINIELYQDIRTNRVIASTERGTPEVLPNRDTALVTSVRSARFAERDTIHSHELQDVINNVMAGNTAAALRTAESEIQRRVSKIKNDFNFTMEYLRLGALQGYMLDADGTVLRDSFSIFGVTPPTTVTVDFANIPEEGLEPFFTDNFYRPITRALQGRGSPATRIMALVGDTFYNKLRTHPGYRKTVSIGFAGGGDFLREGQAWRSIDFAGITFYNYMGTADGTSIAIPANGARFFPVGTDIFRTYWSPGETFKDVNKLGQPLYAYVQPDPNDQMPSYVSVVMRSYPLFICILPQVLMRAQSL